MSIFITEQTKTVKSIKPGDPKFRIQNGITMSDRASIEIHPQCPTYYSQLILEAYQRGWVKPVAHVTEREYILLGLSND